MRNVEPTGFLAADRDGAAVRLDDSLRDCEAPGRCPEMAGGSRAGGSEEQGGNVREVVLRRCRCPLSVTSSVGGRALESRLRELRRVPPERRELERVRDPGCRPTWVSRERSAATAATRLDRRSKAIFRLLGEAAGRPAAHSRGDRGELDTLCSSSTSLPVPIWLMKSRSSTSASRRLALRSTISRKSRAARVRAGGIVVDEQVEVAADRRERRPQLVRDEGDELVLQPVELE